MGCCGQTRSAPPVRRVAAAPPRAIGGQLQPSPAVAAAGASPSGTARLRFVRQDSILVRGPITGRQYAFSGAAPIQQVDVLDAASLLRTSWFRRI
jgi:hypothetical protein